MPQFLVVKTIDWLYGNWAKMCLFIAALLFTALLAFVDASNFPLFLIWLQVPLYLLHQYEEHAWPGGFKDYVNRKVFKTGGEVPLSEKSVFWINIPVVWVLMPLFALLARFGLAFGAWIPYMAAFNALTHIIAAIAKREYNPGFFISLFVTLPVAAYALWVLYQAGVLSLAVNVISITVAVLIHAAIVVYAKTQLDKNKRAA